MGESRAMPVVERLRRLQSGLVLAVAAEVEGLGRRKRVQGKELVLGLVRERLGLVGLGLEQG